MGAKRNIGIIQAIKAALKKEPEAAVLRDSVKGPVDKFVQYCNEEGMLCVTRRACDPLNQKIMVRAKRKGLRVRRRYAPLRNITEADVLAGTVAVPRNLGYDEEFIIERR